jgi:hypothetical protein
MARSRRKAKRGLGGTLLGMLNPLRDPSLLVAIVLTIIWEGSSGDSPLKWGIIFLATWVAVKAFIWLLVNFVFSSFFLLRKAGWVIRNPRLAWRLLDALGTEEIIIGGLRPDMFATEDGSLHDGDLGRVVTAAPGYFGGGVGGMGYSQQPSYGPAYGGYAGGDPYQHGPADMRGADPRSGELQELLSTYARLISDWAAYTEEKWRTVSDSQLGWKPLRGRWNGWDEIYQDSFGVDVNDPAAEAAGEAMARRFHNAREKGSAASSVACFLRDLDTLRQSLLMLDMPDAAGTPRMGGIGPQQPISQRTGKQPIIRNPMIVDAD